MEASQQQLELILARLNNAAKVEVAEIAAASVMDEGQATAAKEASDA